MSDERYTPEERDLPADAEIDTGEPITALATFEVDSSDGFIDRVRRRIERQLVTNDFLSAGWEVPKIVLLEMIEWFAALFGVAQPEEGDRRE